MVCFCFNLCCAADTADILMCAVAIVCIAAAVSQSVGRGVGVAIAASAAGVGGVTSLGTGGFGDLCCVLMTQSVNSFGLGAATIQSGTGEGLNAFVFAGRISGNRAFVINMVRVLPAFSGQLPVIGANGSLCAGLTVQQHAAQGCSSSCCTNSGLVFA